MKAMPDPTTVCLVDTIARSYPRAPFHPGCPYPEFPGMPVSEQPNPVYDGVRTAFRLLGLDPEHYGGRGWNPLGGIIRPGQSVLLKPNLVRHYHPYGLDTDAIYTHGSVIRAVCDYALLALEGSGKLVIADAPLQSCDFGTVRRLSGLDALAAYYAERGATVEIRDLRLVCAVSESAGWFGRVLVQHANEGDPRGYTHVNLGPASFHAAAGGNRQYRVTCYDPSAMARHHGEGRHQYVIANTLLTADTVINLPKMKTHHKAGITGAMKNFIGINGHKDCLPHHRKGSAEEGGDEYPRKSLLKAADSWLLDFKETRSSVAIKKGAAVLHRVLHAAHLKGPGNEFWDGSWYGNETISRTTADLNHIVHFADKTGRICVEPQRRVLTLIDGIIGGDRDGPLSPEPRPSGILIAGASVAACDVVMARAMGFRWDAIPVLRHIYQEGSPFAAHTPAEIEIRSNSPMWSGIRVAEAGFSLGYRPHRGWKGHIEL
jgi:uncharacterized protein (DUF362 family)